MKINKILTAAMALLMFSGCGSNEAASDTEMQAISETESNVTKTSFVSETTSAETAATTPAPPITETETSTSASEENSEEEKKLTWEETRAYFAKNSYKFEYKDLYIDMNEYWDGYDPLADIDEEYLNFMSRLIVENAGSRDLSFLNNYRFSWITLERYSGNADFEKMNFNVLVLDDYKGGDLTTLSNHSPGNYLGPCWLQFTNYSGNEDLSFLAEMDSITGLRFEYYDPGTDFSFISKCPNIKNLELKNTSINAEHIAELMKKSNIKNLDITVEEYSSEDAELIMQAAPDRNTTYIMDDAPWYGGRFYSDCIKVSTNVFVDTAAASVQKSNTDPYNFYYCYTEDDHESLICSFHNSTQEVQTITTAEIYQVNKDVFTPVPFADGSLVYETNLSVEPGCTDFEITEEMFPFSKCEKGIYKIVFNTDNEKTEQQFAICSSDYSFLKKEQQEILGKSYEITSDYFGCSTYLWQEYVDTHTTEEFLENLYPAYTREYAYSRSLGKYIDSDGNLQTAFGDRGGDLTVYANFFMPISSNENEVILKNFVIHYHDNLYFPWYEELNYHMVKTPEGWRFDNYRLWY